MDVQHNCTREHCDMLNQVIVQTPNAIELARLMSECGFDCQQELETLSHQLDQAVQIKATLFPREP